LLLNKKSWKPMWRGVSGYRRELFRVFMLNLFPTFQGKMAHREHKESQRLAADAAERQIQTLDDDVRAELTERWTTVSTIIWVV
jgi:hypothetical protein